MCCYLFNDYHAVRCAGLGRLTLLHLVSMGWQTAALLLVAAPRLPDGSKAKPAAASQTQRSRPQLVIFLVLLLAHSAVCAAQSDTASQPAAAGRALQQAQQAAAPVQ
jgi:hypothetical protein